MLKQLLQTSVFCAVFVFNGQYACAQTSLSEITGRQTLYGYHITTTDGIKSGSWEQLNPDGSVATEWIDEERSYLLSDGWMRRGLLCEIALNDAGNIRSGFAYMTRAVATGEIITRTDYDIITYKSSDFSSAVYSHKNDSIYGYVMDPAEDFYPVWKKAPGYGNLLKIEKIETLTDPYRWCPSLCEDPSTGDFYGITFRGKLVKIDSDGTQTELFWLPEEVSGKHSALAYFPETRKFLWSGILKNDTYALYAIDAEAKTIELIKELEIGEYFTTFVLQRDTDVTNVPSAPNDASCDFIDGARDGKVSFTMPTNLLSGEEITGNLSWTVAIDGVVFAEGKATPAEKITVSLTDIANGERTISIWATWEDIEGSETMLEVYVGDDVPVAPTNIFLEAEGMTLKAHWAPVTQGTHNGWIDHNAMEYDVYLDSKLCDTTKATEWEHTLPENSPLTGYAVSVVARCNGLESVPAFSNTVACGKPLALNVYIAPTQEEAATLTYIGDGEAKWFFNDSYEPPVFSSGSHWDSDSPLDTWMMLPPIEFPAGGDESNYEISFKTAILTDFKDKDYFSVWIGKENNASSMTQQIVDDINPIEVHPAYDEITETFTLAEPGVYYIGFHATSDPGQFGALVWDINVKNLNPSTIASPKQAEEFAYGGQGVINLNGSASANVYTLNGILVQTINLGSSPATVKVPAGLYIIHIGDKTFKIIVK